MQRAMKSETKPRHGGKGRGRQPHRKRAARSAAATQPPDEEEEIRTLEKLIAENAPVSGTQASSNGELRFDTLPLSFRTQQGLKLAKMEVCTEIQAAALPHALVGRDILGAAKTGSGKTLAFVIPLLEKLYRERWSPEEGLGALIITPTRELALQIFEVLRTVGKKHQFSAGLVTGGKKEYAEEQARIVRMNILVSTPGRLLQHLEQTIGFDASKLLVLVLDEADRILDMGFQTQLDNIISYLPTARQTMLFSATQTKSVKDLARLSLRDAEYLAVHAEQVTATPANLIQNYVVVSLEHKLDTLFSFLKSHTQSKIIVFFSTCSQARYAHESFCSLQPGLPLTALHGKIKQERRTMIYMDFLRRPAACMFATDIAARGLDFPKVDWVVQVDAPEDAAMYIHRVGRTARYTATGRALLFLLPQEEKPVLAALTAAQIPLQKLTVNPSRNVSIASKAAALLAAHADYRIFAKKAFVGYLRSLTLLPLYPLRDLDSLPLEGYAKSLGLPFVPDISSLRLPAKEEGGEGEDGEGDVEKGRQALREKKNVNRTLDKLKKQIAEAKEAKRKARQVAKLRAAGRHAEADALEGSGGEGTSLTRGSGEKDAAKSEEEEEEDFLVVKQVHNNSLSEGSGEEELPLSSERDAARKNKLQRQLQRIDKSGVVQAAKQAGRSHVVFDDEGEAQHLTGLLGESDEEGEGDGDGAAGGLRLRIEERLKNVRAQVEAGRSEDEARDKQRVKEKRLKEKQLRDKLKKSVDEEEEAVEAEEEEEEEGEEGEEVEGEVEGEDSEEESDSQSSGSEEEDSEAEDSSATSEEEEEESGDEEDRGPRKRGLPTSIQEQEALALRLLENKRARK